MKKSRGGRGGEEKLALWFFTSFFFLLPKEQGRLFPGVKRKGLVSLYHEENSLRLFVRSRRREGDCLNAKKETLALPSVPVHCHQAALECKRQLLPFPRLNLRYWKENTRPPILTVPTKDHSEEVYGTHLFVMQPAPGTNPLTVLCCLL